MPKYLSQLGPFILLFGFSTASGLMKIFLISVNLLPNDFGFYLGIILAAGLFSYSSSLGIFDAFLVAPRNSSEEEDLRKKIQGGLTFSSLLSVCLLTLGIVVFSYQHPSLSDLTLPAALFIFLQIRINGLMCIAQGDNRPILYAAITGLKNILPVFCLLSFNFGSLVSIILIETISYLVVIICLHTALKINLVSWFNFTDTFKFM